MLAENAQKLAIEAIALNEKLFLVHFEVSDTNKITILIDGDEGITIDECVRISRHIEHNLDREQEDFSLEVSSPGTDFPLQGMRHYTKNIGRTLEIITHEDKKIRGILTHVNHEDITIEWAVREPKTIGKGKQTVTKQEKIAYMNIKQALVQIIF